MKSKLLVLGVLAVLMLGTVAPSFGSRASAAVVVAPVASATHSHPALFDKTRFLLHVGFAYYAFHHFIYARYTKGGFAKGAPGRIGNFVKAALAAAFAYHEVKVAIGIANNSNSKILHTLVSPLNGLGASMTALGAKLHGNNATASDFQSVNSQANSFQQTAGSNGVSVQDVKPPVAAGLS